MALLHLLEAATACQASDLHLSAGMPPWVRVRGELWPLAQTPVLSSEQIESSLLQWAPQALHAAWGTHRNLDFALELAGLGRFRVNAFVQQRGASMALRSIASEVPSLAQLHAPEAVSEWAEKTHGLLLITGPTGCGKSTLLAALLQHINQHRRAHILTLEDPIEFVHTPAQCLVQQREVGRDTPDFDSGLRAGLREDPDVIMVGELRDLATIRLALTAAETGHLVLATLHTESAPQAVDRLVDAFPPGEKEGVRSLFAQTMVAVLAQTLCPDSSGSGRVAAHEIMVGTPAVRNLIREGKVSQLYSAIQTGQAFGMQTLDQSLLALLERSQISRATLQRYARYPQNLTLTPNPAAC